MTVLSEEKTDYNKAFIKGKLDVLEDIGKRFKKMDKAKLAFLNIKVQKLANYEFFNCGDMIQCSTKAPFRVE